LVFLYRRGEKKILPALRGTVTAQSQRRATSVELLKFDITEIGYIHYNWLADSRIGDLVFDRTGVKGRPNRLRFVKNQIFGVPASDIVEVSCCGTLIGGIVNFSR
jgi:hypothetical protein